MTDTAFDAPRDRHGAGLIAPEDRRGQPELALIRDAHRLVDAPVAETGSRRGQVTGTFFHLISAEEPSAPRAQAQEEARIKTKARR